MKIKYILFILVILILINSLAGCGQKKVTATVSMYDLQTAMLSADSTLPDMSSVNGSSEDAAELFAYLSDLSYDKVETYFLAYSTEGKADEIAVIAVKDAANVGEAEKSLDACVEKRRKLYEQYDPTQTERVEKALVFTNGQYAVLIICDKASDVKEAFESFIAEAAKET